MCASTISIRGQSLLGLPSEQDLEEFSKMRYPRTSGRITQATHTAEVDSWHSALCTRIRFHSLRDEFLSKSPEHCTAERGDVFNVTQVDMYGEVGAAKTVLADNSIEELEDVVATKHGLFLVKTRYCVAGEVDYDPYTGTTTALLIPISTHRDQDLSVKWAKHSVKMTEYMNIREVGDQGYERLNPHLPAEFTRVDVVVGRTRSGKQAWDVKPHAVLCLRHRFIRDIDSRAV